MGAIGKFAGERSWGDNPAHVFSVEMTDGGPLAFKQFIKRAHQSGIAVILDGVYNHLGPSDLDLWQLDGWQEEYHIDGLRFDYPQFIPTIHGSEDHDLSDGWSLLQWINREISRRFPGRLAIAAPSGLSKIIRYR